MKVDSRRIRLAAGVFALSIGHANVAQSFAFDDIEFWVGTGANRAALVIDWVEDASEPPALAWGFRWDGTAHGSDMLTAIVAADRRLFAKLGGTPGSPNAVRGLGYDANGDGQFELDDGTVFDDDGIAYSGPADLATAIDAADYYAEGWVTAFWHYGVASSNPYDGGNWTSAPVGMTSRTLTDGAWDSWVFSPTFDFAAFAENPAAAPPLYGDYNGDGTVDALDYGVWQSGFGFIGAHAADGNGDGIVDAADYTVWRDHANAAANLSAASAITAPEPAAWILLLLACLMFRFVVSRSQMERLS